MMQDTFTHKGLRLRMVESLKEKGITDEAVLKAMNDVPRHFFLPAGLDVVAYDESPVKIGFEQTISRPSTVAMQSQLLQVKRGMKVLEIGTGSGYQTAVLCRLGARVFTIERQKGLFDHTKPLLQQLGYNARCFLGDGYKGLTEANGATQAGRHNGDTGGRGGAGDATHHQKRRERGGVAGGEVRHFQFCTHARRKGDEEMRKNVLMALVVCCMLAACNNGDYTPKPQAYLRIDMPEHNYWLVDTLPTFKAGDTIMYGGDTMVILDGSPYMMFPFIFEANQCVELAEKDSPKGEVWLDIRYPQWDGVVFLTYKHLAGADDLRGQTDTSMHLIEKHYKFASGIDEQQFESDDHTVHAVTWKINGPKVASTYQFYATDSAHHFLRGALYLNKTPNNDSLAPVINYIQEDIDHLIETLRWR